MLAYIVSDVIRCKCHAVQIVFDASDHQTTRCTTLCPQLSLCFVSTCFGSVCVKFFIFSFQLPFFRKQINVFAFNILPITKYELRITKYEQTVSDS